MRRSILVVFPINFITSKTFIQVELCTSSPTIAIAYKMLKMCQHQQNMQSATHERMTNTPSTSPTGCAQNDDGWVIFDLLVHNIIIFFFSLIFGSGTRYVIRLYLLSVGRRQFSLRQMQSDIYAKNTFSFFAISLALYFSPCFLFFVGLLRTISQNVQFVKL